MLEHLPIPSIELEVKQRQRDFYDRTARKRAWYRRLNWYYHKQQTRYLKSIIPQGVSVLEIGCGDGRLLHALNPSRGLGIDFSPQTIELAKRNENEHISFMVADAEFVAFKETFDYVVLFDCIGNLLDIQRALTCIKTACTPATRIVIGYHSISWEPLLKLLESLRLKMPQPHHNWLSDADIRNFALLCGLDIVKYERRMLMPAYFPLIANLLNRFFAPLPLVNRLCLSHLFVARTAGAEPKQDLSVSILVPCRNEKENVQALVDRLPEFGTHQEILFIEGHSTDGTLEAINETVRRYPDRDLKVCRQSGKGKADAVHTGFSVATGEVLMILDADLTVTPESLPVFYEAIKENRGELVMGTRLVYPMERQAMRFLNILGNHIFSWLFSWILNQTIKDTLCGTKVMRRPCLEKIQKTRDYFGDFDPFGDFELIFGAAKQNLKILEIPIRYRERTYGKTNINRFTHGWLLLKMSLFALRKMKMI